MSEISESKGFFVSVMTGLKVKAQSIFSSPRKTAFLTVVVLALYSLKTVNSWHTFANEAPYQFRSDVDQYYSYLPATFVHGDIFFNFPNSYWLVPTESGGLTQKMTMGMAFMYLPFFLIGHVVAPSLGYEADGYTKPYSIAIRAGTIFYFLFGIFLLVLLLSRMWGGLAVFLTAMMMFFGTNLLNYVLNEGEFTHSYLFVVYCALIYLTVRWHKTGERSALFGLSFLIGLATLIRPTEIISVIFPVLYGVYDGPSLRSKWTLIRSKLRDLFIALFFMILPILPQIIYWKLDSGSWFLYSYGSEERFFFNDPKWMEFLFGFRKGWLLYAPLMLIPLVSLVVFRRKLKEWVLPVGLIVLISIYVLSSWWCWWFGGGQGMRAMVQYYAFLAIPFAATIHAILDKTVLLRTTIMAVLVVAVWFGFRNNHKYRHFQIHWDGMTKESFLFTMKRSGFTAEEMEEFLRLCDPPDYAAAMKGNR
jgi:hypothetical protein